MTTNVRRIPFVLVLIVFVGAPLPAAAMWAGIPLDDAVRDSDLIVVGTLSDVAECSWAGWDYGNGTIAVREVLWGDARAGDRLRLRWRNLSALACPRVEHASQEGIEYVWLFTRSSDGSVRADHPCRSVPTRGRADVVRALAGERKTVCLRSVTSQLSSDSVDVVTLVFRNPSAAPVSYPGVEPAFGGVRLDPRVRLALYQESGPDGPEISPKPGAIAVSSDVAPIVVLPGEEVRVEIRVRALFDLGPGAYWLRATVAGYEPSNSVIVDLRSQDDFALFALIRDRRHSIAAALVELVSASLALVGLGIWRLRVASTSAPETYRRTLTLVVLEFSVLTASIAVGHSATILWSAIPVVW